MKKYSHCIINGNIPSALTWNGQLGFSPLFNSRGSNGISGPFGLSLAPREGKIWEDHVRGRKNPRNMGNALWIMDMSFKKHSQDVFLFFWGIEASHDWGLIIKSFRLSHQTLHGLVMFTAKNWISLGPAPSPSSHAQSSKLEFHMQRVGHCHPSYVVTMHADTLSLNLFPPKMCSL